MTSKSLKYLKFRKCDRGSFTDSNVFNEQTTPSKLYLPKIVSVHVSCLGSYEANYFID